MMHKLLENVEKELRIIEENGLKKDNLDLAGKLVDIYKDLKTVEEMEHGAAVYYSDSSTSMKRDGYKFDRNLNELYDRYLQCKKEYKDKGDQAHRTKVMESIESLMTEICDLLFDIHRDCDFREEREIVSKHIGSIADMK